jgi:hypothetical protein
MGARVSGLVFVSMGYLGATYEATCESESSVSKSRFKMARPGTI